MRNRFTGEWSFGPFLRPDDGSGSGEPAADPAAAAPVETPVAADPSAAAAAPVVDPNAGKPQKDWRDKEIARKHARIKQLEEETAHLRALADAAVRPTERPVPAADPVDPAAAAPVYHAPAPQPQRVDDAAVERRAQQISDFRTLEDKLTDAVNTAKSKHGSDWDSAFDNIRTMGGIDPETLKIIAASDAPGEVLFTLGNKPEEFQRLMDLPPARRNTEIIKMGIAAATPPAAKPGPSNAPAPVEPITTAATTGAAKFDLYDQKIEKFESSPWENVKADKSTNDDRWFAERARQKAESKGRPWSVSK